MGRTKAAPRRGKPQGYLIVPANDPFPTELLGDLIDLSRRDPKSDTYDDSYPADSEPPTKKAKLSADTLDHRHIARHEVVLTRPRDTSTDQLPEALEFRDVDSRLKISYHAQSRTGTNELHVSVPRQPPLVYKLRHVPMSDATTAKLEVCGLVASKAEPRDQQGSLWTSVTVRVEKVASSLQITFTFDIQWNITTSPYNLRNARRRDLSQRVLAAFFPEDAMSVRKGPGHRDMSLDDGWSPLDFYESAFVPSSDDTSVSDMAVPGLNATLYPYQRRTVQWLLNREGVSWVQKDDIPGSGVEELQPTTSARKARSFKKIEPNDGSPFYLSHLYHAITVNLRPFEDLETAVKGGILAEEMGLGKTLEVISLILLHKRKMGQNVPLQVNGVTITPSAATLIVCPESLREQWMTELQRHAPHLLVSCYPGRGKMGGSINDESLDEDELVTHLAHQDVVVTTYKVLTAEVHYANEPPERSRRHERAYRRPKSPLTQISWWRVCLDEAQMIESGVSPAASVAQVLYRVNSWGVTGTPVKNDVKDLFGLLLFLQYQPYCSAPHIWRALTDHHKSLFRELFHDIAIRHTKHLVRHELSIPAQHRFVITMPFTAVEEQHYRSLFAAMAEACGLDVKGDPISPTWNPDDYEDVMRSWLVRLRQTALHPEVGLRNRRALGQKAGGSLRTVDEVLQAMIEQSDNAVRTEQRTYFNARLSHGLMLENGPRVKEALAIWESVKADAEVVVASCRTELRVAIQEAKEQQTSYQEAGDNEGDEVSSGTISDPESQDDLEEGQAGSRLVEARLRYRYAQELLHRAVFFCANAHFQIKTNTNFTAPDSAEFEALQKLEEEEYEAAKRIRREILSMNHRKATKHMNNLEALASSQNFVEVPDFEPNTMTGLQSAPTIERVESLFKLLNLQAEVIDEWREAIIQLLIKPLVDEEEEEQEGKEVTGDEFADSTKIQEELMVYVQMLGAVIADRQEAISGLENTLVKHELHVAATAAKENEGPAPQKFLELLAVRDGVKPSLVEHGCLRGAIGEFRALLAKLPSPQGSAQSHARLEHEVITRQIKDTQAQIQAQTKAAQALERENDKFTTAMNARSDYYRQLQAVSDSVAPLEGPIEERNIAISSGQIEIARKKLNNLEGRHRYLLSLQKPGASEGETRMCIICQSPFSTGVLTACGHQFCKECLMMWLKAHQNCPMCKKSLKMSDLYNITLKPRELKLHTEPDAAASSSDSKRHSSPKKTGIYTQFGSEKLAQINDIDLDGPSFTTKVDSIVRHILWLRDTDPGAKSVIFSQYRDFLSVLSSAFTRYRIGYTSIDHPNGTQRFKEDAGTECFLLHGRAQSSGLNLVNANHVFLCEPVLNTALELQAIARVDRIGQQHETTVWLYLIEGTVEESIYNLSARRRMEHMSKRTTGNPGESEQDVPEDDLEVANTLEMEQASLSKLMSKDKSAGEAVMRQDLWECLFGQVSKAAAEETMDVEGLDNSAVRGFLAAEAAEGRVSNGS